MSIYLSIRFAIDASRAPHAGRSRNHIFLGGRVADRPALVFSHLARVVDCCVNAASSQVAAAVPSAKVHAVLQVCSIAGAATCDLLIQAEGFGTLGDIAVAKGDTNITEMAKCLALCLAVGGRVLLGTAQIKRLQGLVWQLRDCLKHHQRLGAAKLVAQAHPRFPNRALESLSVSAGHAV